jgi:hypothetical protein
MALADVGAGQDDFGAHRPQVADLLVAHLVGDDDGELVALLGGDQGEGDAGVAGGGLDDAGAAAEFAPRVRPLRSSRPRCGP